MKFAHIAIVSGVAAAAMTGVSVYAGDDHRKDDRDSRRAEAAMQVVSVTTSAGEPGHGWQYFSDARKRAVVISPAGDYYYSRGKGLRLVHKGSEQSSDMASGAAPAA